MTAIFSERIHHIGPVLLNAGHPGCEGISAREGVGEGISQKA